MFFLRVVKIWIVVSTLASVAGWTLSALGMLNKTGYSIFAAAVVVLVFLFRKSLPFSPLPSIQEFKKQRHRFRRLLPAGFMILAALVFVSGLLYAPNGHTGLSYRIPRVMQWLQHGRWFWIHTPNYRMNDRACGIEWLSAPLLLFLKSDRALFLLNFIPFVLMPGLIFSIWTRLGVRPRVAWSWMWLVPTGYCFLMQAGGIANDAFPTVYALAMMDFALRAGLNAETGSNFNRRFANLSLSLLSAALVTGAKASNLPLGLPWALVFFPACWIAASAKTDRSVFRVPRSALRVGLVLLIALVVSFLPTAILNIHYLHNWSGLNIEHAGMDMKNPMVGILGNGVLFLTNNFVPTFFPLAGWWTQHSLSYFPGALVHLMDANFESGYQTLGEMPTEDWSGIGFGISMLLVISIVAGIRYSGTRSAERGTRKRGQGSLQPLLLRAVLIAPWISLLVYCMKTGMVTPARLITPYYPLLMPALLHGAGQSQIVRRCWWRVLSIGVFVLALAALILTPPRPLWPARTILSKAVVMHPNQPQLLRAQKVYEAYGVRADALAGMREWFPPGLTVIGFMGMGDDLDISLWKPYGSRRVEPFLLTDPPEKIRGLGIEYAMVSGLNLTLEKTTIEEWLQRSGAELIATTNVMMTVSQGPQPWYFVRMKK